MKSLITSVFLLSLAVAPASAVITLGTSAQTFTLTGIGPNSAGQGQSHMSWGSCSFDGTNTTCTLSGTYTGPGSGGSYSFVVSYAGNGTFPLNAITNPGSNQFFASATNNYNFLITLTPTSGTPIHFYSFYNFNFQYASPVCSGVSTCTVSQVGQTAGATISGQITGTFDPTPVILPGGALTPDGYGSSLSTAPGSWLVMYGYNLATVQTQTWAGTDFNNNVGPTSLGGTTVTIAGIPAYVDYVSPGQVNVEVPSGVPAGAQNIVVTTAGGASTAYSINANAVNPGVLAPSSFIFNGNQYIVAQLGSSYVLPSTVTGLPVTRARPGDTITFYGIGFGPVTPNINAGQIVTVSNTLQLPLQVFIGGVQAQVNYDGLVPSIVGLYQFNVVVPNVPASDTTPITFMLNGVAGTQKMVIAIQSN